MEIMYVFLWPKLRQTDISIFLVMVYSEWFLNNHCLILISILLMLFFTKVDLNEIA